MSTRSDDRRQNPNHLTGPRKSALYDYKSDLKDAIAPVLVDLPLTALSRDAVAQSMHAMSDKGASGKTVANRHGFCRQHSTRRSRRGASRPTPPSLSSGALGRQGISGRWLIRRRSYCR